MLFARWIRKALTNRTSAARRSAGKARPNARFRPRVEQLEERLAPSATTLYSFTGRGSDGASPYAGLIADSSGDLFGTTGYGGSANLGTVFELVNDGGGSYTHNTLYSFTGTGNDGSIPAAGLIADSSGDLFGTTRIGGSSGSGTVFELLNNGGGIYTHNTLYSFTGTDGSDPFGTLITDSSGDLFGTTYGGGSSGSGTVFELVNNGGGIYTHNTLYSFTGTGTDGAEPQAGLIADSSGDLFGTTATGGSSARGTVFELVNNGGGSYTHNTLYSFTGTGTDGAGPQAGLILDSSGDLFGTTVGGGFSGITGTVFELVNKGGGSYAHNTLYSFTGGGAGWQPLAGLLADSSGDLFGTTHIGGGSSDSGAVFELVNNGGGSYTLKTLYSFTGTPDGAAPQAGLIADSSGDLYGTTATGGGSNGYGTVFEVSTAPTLSLSDGNNQSADAGKALSNPLTVKVTDNAGNPISGVIVHWAATAGGSVSSPVRTTNSSGLASINATLGPTAGNYTYTATVAGLTGSPVTFDETADKTANPPIVVSPTTSTGLPLGSAGSNYNQTISASGGAGGTYTFTTTDPLDGLTLSSSGILSGSPIVGGSFTFTVTATDGLGGTGSQAYTLIVLPILTVSTTADTAAINPANSPLDSSGNISLRSAILFANANNLAATIDFAASIGNTITLTGPLPQIKSNLTIQGPGAAALAISGNMLYRVFYVTATVAISGLTITEGSGSIGGAIYQSGGSLTLSNDSISGNSASNGGAIFNFEGRVTLSNDILSGNSASSLAGGIYNDNGTVALSNDTLSGNSAASSGGGIYNQNGTLTLGNDTLSGNSAAYRGGGIYIASGGNINLTNDTLSGNSSAYGGGGIYNAYNGNLTLSNDTIANNSATTTGGGIYNRSSGTVSVYDTIIAANTASTGPDYNGPIITDNGYNLVGNTSGSSGFTGNILNPAFVGLGALQNNGGPTQTIALLPGTPRPARIKLDSGLGLRLESLC